MSDAQLQGQSERHSRRIQYEEMVAHLQIFPLRKGGYRSHHDTYALIGGELRQQLAFRMAILRTGVVDDHTCLGLRRACCLPRADS